MFIENFEIIPIIVGSIIATVFGSFWYSDQWFGKTWMKYGDVSEDAVIKSHSKGNAVPHIASFFATLLSAIALYYLVNSFAVHNLYSSLLLTFLVWAGLIIPILIDPVIWEAKNHRLFWVNAGYRFISILIIILAIVWVK